MNKVIGILLGLLIVTSTAFATTNRVFYHEIDNDKVGTVRTLNVNNYATMEENIPEGSELLTITVDNDTKAKVKEFEAALVVIMEDMTKAIYYNKDTKEITVE